MIALLWSTSGASSKYVEPMLRRQVTAYPPAALPMAFACVYARMYIYIRMYIYKYTCLCVSIFVCLYLVIYVHECVCVYACTHA